MRALLEVMIFGLAVVALVASTGAALAIIFGAIACANAILDHRLGRDQPTST